jgi:hypothetical protein
MCPAFVEQTRDDNDDGKIFFHPDTHPVWFKVCDIVVTKIFCVAFVEKYKILPVGARKTSRDVGKERKVV